MREALVRVILAFASARPQKVLPGRDSFIFLAFPDQTDVIHFDSRHR